MALQIQLQPHQSLLALAFIARWRAPIGQLPPLSAAGVLLTSQLGSCKVLPEPDAAVRAAIRDMLRSPDFKPTGRSKPSSEYLARAGSEGTLRAINPAVDACNAVSLHSGIPISVVDCDRLTGPLQIRLAAKDESYVFNPTGQVIDVAGLVCLCDANGPCANAIKDAQRTKTSDSTQTTLSILWSSQALAAQTAAALELYRSLLTEAAEIEHVALGS
jgi:DNA/RNA-binding domain of Phe-tRNA-synthetase-like protein